MEGTAWDEEWGDMQRWRSDAHNKEYDNNPDRRLKDCPNKLDRPGSFESGPGH